MVEYRGVELRGDRNPLLDQDFTDAVETEAVTQELRGDGVRLGRVPGGLDGP